MFSLFTHQGEDSRRLDQPAPSHRFAVDVDPDTFGRFAERIARFLGTGKYLFCQTLIVVVWIGVNVCAVSLAWDPYPFILLNLAFSTQAAYAAPLILLAQNRQDDRDRAAAEQDRTSAEQDRADTEYLTRELAALRQAVRDVATRDHLRGELERLREELATLRSAPAHPDGPTTEIPATTEGTDGGAADIT